MIYFWDSIARSFLVLYCRVSFSAEPGLSWIKQNVFHIHNTSLKTEELLAAGQAKVAYINTSYINTSYINTAIASN